MILLSSSLCRLYRSKALKLSCTCLLFLVLSGCTQKTTIVLVSDHEGHVGNLTVTSNRGEVEMNRPNEATIVSGRETSPSKPEIVSEQQISANFSVVLAALPKQPEHFLLYFEKGTINLTTDSVALLPQILQAIAGRNSEDIDIIGHSDTAGDRDSNVRLSRERALAVSQIFVQKGVPAAHITSSSHGEENPLIKTADNVPEAKNRRVEVVIK